MSRKLGSESESRRVKRNDNLKVTEHEFELLDIMYRFRFASISLLKQATSTSQVKTVQQRADKLMKLGLIDRRYDAKVDRIARRPAAYYLTPRGIDAVARIDETVPEIAKRLVYKNKTVSRIFADRCLKVLELALSLEQKTNRPGGFFSPIQLRAFNYFPQPLPDGFLTTSDDRDGESYFIEYCETSKPAFVHVKKIKKYLEYFDSNEWEPTGMDFPTVLLACESEDVKSAIYRKVGYVLEGAGFEVRFVCS